MLLLASFTTCLRWQKCVCLYVVHYCTHLLTPYYLSICTNHGYFVLTWAICHCLEYSKHSINVTNYFYNWRNTLVDDFVQNMQFGYPLERKKKRIKWLTSLKKNSNFPTFWINTWNKTSSSSTKCCSYKKQKLTT